MPESVDSLFLAFQGAVAGRYSLEHELGRGGMGVVYLAREVRLDRLVAIKLLPPELGAQATLRDRFLREARTAAKLSHPNIVPIFAVDEAGDFVFYAMAYIDGQTLAQRLAARGPVPPGEATRILREVAWALAHAHAQGVVHRDVKPANILLERESGRALVADFGIARLARGGGETTEGERLGTPEFMSPEQASGEPVDGRSDLYSLGVVGFVALSGRPPFAGDSVQAVLAQQITKPAPPVASIVPGVGRALAQAIDRCLQKDPAARFADASTLAETLGESIERRTDVPVAVRVFLDRRRSIAAFIPLFVIMPLAARAISDLARTGRLTGSALAMITAQLGLAIAIPPAVLLTRLRRLRKLGYGPDDLVLGLRDGFQRRREEFQFEYGMEPSRREQACRAMALAGAITFVAATAAEIAHAAPFSLWPFSILGGYLVILAGAFSARWSRLRKGTGSAWAHFWNAGVGRWLSRVAGFGLRERALPVDRPTEIAIAMSAEVLYAELPKESRRALGDFSDVLRRLETRARQLRGRIEALDAGVVEVERVRRGATSERQEALLGDFRALRAQAQSQLTQVVTALETLRLDLLRHRIGGATLDGMTADLAAARELGEQTDRLLDARREVERALGRSPQSSTG